MTLILAADFPHLYAIARQWLEQGHRAAIATLFTVSGSSPCPPGSQMIVREDGLFEGSVSAGCLEGAVVSTALEVIATGAPQRMDIDPQALPAWAEGPICGGRMAVFVQRLNHELLSALTTLLMAEEDSGLLVELATGSFRPVSAALLTEVPEAARTLLIQRRTGSAGLGHILIVAPARLRLVLIGASHIAQHLSAMATLAGHTVIVVDPRRAFATPDRFPDIALHTQWPDEFLREYPPDRYTAVVVLSHDSKIDDPALVVALLSPAFFIGALGSRQTHAARLRRLAGICEDRALARIQGPIGLPIGAQGPWEIAVSIMAAVVSAWRIVT